MKNYSDETPTPYGGYRGAATVQPLDAPQQHCYSYQQPYFAPPAGYTFPYERISMRMRAPAAGWLSYLGGWVTGLIFLLLKRENGFVRFHAMQSLIFFGALGILTTAFNHIAFLSSIGVGLGFVTFICWIVLIVKAARGKYYKLPIIGDYAEKWANSLKD